MDNRQVAGLLQALLRSGQRQRNPRWKIASFAVVFALIVAYVLVKPYLDRWGLTQPEPPTASRQSETDRTLPSSSRSRSTTAPSKNVPPAKSSERTTRSSNTAIGEDEAILDAFHKGRSNVQVQGSGVVAKNLPDDTIGDQHQKMIVKLKSGHTIQIAHNIDLASRVPAKAGDTIEFNGEYEYSEKGGVVHWTHRDPGRRHSDGWIDFLGKRYD